MKNIFTILLLTCSSLLFAQAPKATIDAEQVALNYLNAHKEDWHLSYLDTRDILLSNKVLSKHNGVTSLYYTQRYKGIEIYNAIFNINVLPSGKVLSANSRFIPNIKNKITKTNPITNAKEALTIAFKELNLSTNKIPNIRDKKTNLFRYKKGDIAQNDMTNQLLFFPQGGILKLIWEINIHPISDDSWSIKIDAATGEIISKTSLTLHCNLEHLNFNTNEQHSCNHTPKRTYQNNEQAANDGSSYRVFPYYVESPLYGGRALLTEPAILSASPYGWHDTNGMEGAEYTITRGNNVHAYLDLNNTNISSNDEPDGGASLTFDFPFNTNGEPSNNRDAAVTNLFYMNNFMHDFSFQYGFDEDAGNFQSKNYTGPNIKQNDPVRAHAQDGKGINNANFTTPNDGASPTLQMQIFVNQGAKFLNIISPSSISGTLPTGTATFGPSISATPITGEVVLIGNNNPEFGCNAFSQDLTNKIALLDRGGCVYAQKALNAQAKGAIGLIIVNYENSLVGMTSPASLGDQVNIPLVSITLNQGDIIKNLLTSGSPIEASFVINNLPSPDSLDSDFSNNIIAHEYSHGISNRLTGGGFNNSCLFNDEQMGEGWSDFFALAVSAKESDTGAEAKGLGNYVLRKGANGEGGRRVPYSTDFAINPLTYYDIINTKKPHDVGEVWASCLWDLYWLMVEQHGFDNDIYNGTGGNNKTIQLVMDGMKLQPCSPGFIDARDAILAADVANNNGANQCLIWSAFAKRGLGLSAKQGDSDNRNDGTEAYDKPQSCTQALAINKKMTPVINAGEKINVKLTISNFKGNDLTGVLVNDVIPENTNFVMGSSSISSTVSGNIITFDIGDMTDKTQQTITYQLSTGGEFPSTSLWSDNFDFNDTKWITEAITGENFWNWEMSKSLGYSHSGDYSFFLVGEDGASEQMLSLKDPVQITGSKPILRFFQHYNTKPGQDGGILEFSIDNGANWIDASNYFFREGYARPMDYWTFGYAGQDGFSGNSEQDATDGYVETMVDLSSFIGENLDMRFHFATHYENFDEESIIWSIDDVEFLDMVHYNSEACVSSAQGDQDCAFSSEKGTVVYSSIFVENEEIKDPDFNFTISPNPTSDFINIHIQSDVFTEATIRILNLNGQAVLTQKTNLGVGQQTIGFLVDLSAGVYFIQVESLAGFGTKKLILQ